jgi:hypothetical protein
VSEAPLHPINKHSLKAVALQKYFEEDYSPWELRLRGYYIYCSVCDLR